MEYIKLKARAKINLALDVLGKREDGYHELLMIMQSLQLHDNLFIKKTVSNDITLVTNLHYLPNGDRNLVYKAVQFLRKEYKIKSGVFIELKKNIPVSAGLGGGSADCAAALIGMKILFSLPINNRELLEMGKTFGADVPFCIMQGTALAKGVGEKLERLPPHPQIHILLAKPPINVSTASVFKNFRMEKVVERPNVSKLVTSIRNKNIYELANGMCNVLETVTEDNYPVITKLKEIMLENNAINTLMSGSGPSVFGYYKNKSDAENAYLAIKNEITGIKEVFITNPYNPVKEFIINN